MFNEETKSAFLDSLASESTKIMYKSLFTRAGSFETSKGKDILRFDVDECTDLVSFLSPKSLKHVVSIKSQLKKYANWGILEGINSRNCWLAVPADDDSVRHSFAKRYVKDLDELVAIVEHGISVPYDKYIVYLLYMGIMGRDFFDLRHLRDMDIDISSGIIRTRRCAYRIIPPLHKAITNGGYYEETKKRNELSEYFVKPYNTKDKKDEPINYNHIHRVFRKLNDELQSSYTEAPKTLTPMSVWRSGLYNAMYKIEAIKGGIVSDDFKEVSRVYGNKNTFSSYLRDYEMYKEIFWAI